jgi:hypothetical protein
MKRVFDCVVIGAGPSSVGVLSAIPQGLDVGIATGDGLAGRGLSGSDIHSKIKSVASGRRELVGIREAVSFKGEKRGSLCATSIIGGLANYWGQQFVRYLENDLWPRDVFRDYKDYIGCCEAIESLFVCSTQSAAIQEEHIGERYVKITPRLLIGTPDAPESGLLAMGQAFSLQIKRIRATMNTGVVRSLHIVDGLVKIKFDDDEEWTAKKVFLSAGVVGSLRIILTSCENLFSAQLSDHAPQMKYLFRKNRSLEARRHDSLRHFNALSIEHRSDGKVKLFASIYRMSQATLSLSLAAIGLPAFFSRTYPPKAVDFILPVQIWTDTTKSKYQILKGQSQAIVHKQYKNNYDSEIDAFEQHLSNYGFLTKGSTTPPGFGYHYHNAEVSNNGLDYEPLTTYVDNAFEGKVLCADASLMKEIGTRPHTLSMMAAAHAVTRNYLNSKKT